MRPIAPTKPMKIKAVFKGENGSCGYVTNTEYILYIEQKQNPFIVRIEIYKEERGGYCTYSSIIAFLKNWDNIRVIN